MKPENQSEEFGSWAKILIVEDNVSIADIYKTRMEMMGYICFVAHEGNEALAMIEKERPSLVLLDLMVPGVAGDQILKRMRASEWGKDIKVLIISNLNESEAPAGLREQGIEGYAVKANLTDDQLDKLVNNILKRSEQPQTSVSRSQPAKTAPLLTGLKSIIYPSTNLASDKAFWVSVSCIEPYVDQPYYVGFKLGDYELGLDPNALHQGISHPVCYWFVRNVDAASKQIMDSGATVFAEPRDVGGGIMMATFKDKSGSIFGVIERG